MSPYEVNDVTAVEQNEKLTMSKLSSKMSKHERFSYFVKERQAAAFTDIVEHFDKILELWREERRRSKEKISELQTRLDLLQPRITG